MFLLQSTTTTSFDNKFVLTLAVNFLAFFNTNRDGLHNNINTTEIFFLFVLLFELQFKFRIEK